MQIRSDILEEIRKDKSNQIDNSQFEPSPLQLEIPVYQEPIEASYESFEDDQNHSSSVIIIEMA